MLRSTRIALGEAIAASRKLARLSRADLARALGTTEEILANLEHGSIAIERTEI